MRLASFLFVFFSVTNVFAGEFRCQTNRVSWPPSTNLEIRGCITSDKAPKLCDDLKIFEKNGELLRTVQKELVTNLYASDSFIALSYPDESRKSASIRLEYFGENQKSNFLSIGFSTENTIAYLNYKKNLKCTWLQ